MKIVEAREKTVSIASEIKNAFIDFSAMTVSIPALYTDVIREGRPVVGYGFISNGRYSQGCLLRERFIPRIMNSHPEKLHLVQWASGTVYICNLTNDINCI